MGREVKGSEIGRQTAAPRDDAPCSRAEDWQEGGGGVRLREGGGGLVKSVHLSARLRNTLERTTLL